MYHGQATEGSEGGMAEPMKVPQHETPEEYEARIADLFEKERVPGARRLIDEALQRYPDDPGLLAWWKALSPPEVRIGGARDVDRTTEYRWLQAHGSSYRGEWVAVLGDRLLAHSSDPKEMRAKLDAIRTDIPPLVVRVQDR
jgi:hypothetical protein